MEIFLCLEDRGGMLFHGRRLSRDRAVTADLLAAAGPAGLWVAPFSRGLFAPGDPVRAAEDFLLRAGERDACFVEDRPLLPHLARIRAVTVYRWNRRYPFDRALDLDLSQWRLASVEEFPGYSHPILTKERYIP